MTTWVFYYNFVPEALHCPGIQVLHCYLGDPDKEIQTNLRTEILVDTQMKVWAFFAVFDARDFHLRTTNFVSPAKPVKKHQFPFSLLPLFLVIHKAVFD